MTRLLRYAKIPNIKLKNRTGKAKILYLLSLPYNLQIVKTFIE